MLPFRNLQNPRLFPGAFIHATEDVLLLDLQGVEEVEVGQTWQRGRVEITKEGEILGGVLGESSQLVSG